MNSSGKNPDKMPAEATYEERRRLMKTQVKKFKSSDTDKMVSISIPHLRITYFCKSSKREMKIMELMKRYPDKELIVKNPIDKK